NLAKHEKQKGTEGKLIVVTSNNKAVFTLDLLEIEQKSGNGHIDGATGQDWIGINYVIDDHPMTYKRVEFKMLPEHISTFTEFTCDHVNYYDNSKDNEEQMKSSTSKKKKNHVSRDSPIQTQSANQNTSRHWDSLDSSSTSSDPESPAANPLIPDDQIALHQISAGNPGTKRKNTTINTPTSISANLPAPNDGDPEEVILISALIKDARAQPPGAPPPKGSWIPISKSFDVPGGIRPTAYQCERYHGRMQTSFKEIGYLMIHHNGQWNNSINQMEAVRQFDLDGGVAEVQRVEALNHLLANVSLTRAYLNEKNKKQRLKWIMGNN
ncbi:hypothetical protein MJO28_004532, partial [Puccinia striiformis f. sp. tritici]